ncbi:hypothetical protein C0995_008620 [Termitomyces sp. Mi166|nr:hypothetical protein C0995_008620 [Termitomyces sp. Mi166\
MGQLISKSLTPRITHFLAASFILFPPHNMMKTSFALPISPNLPTIRSTSKAAAALVTMSVNGSPSSPLSLPPALPSPLPQLPTAAATSSDPAHSGSAETAPAQGQTLHPSVLPPVLMENQDPPAGPPALPSPSTMSLTSSDFVPDSSSLISSPCTMTSKEAVMTQASASQPPVIFAGTLTVEAINLLEKFSKHYFLHKNIVKVDQVEKLLFYFEGVAQQAWIAAKEAEFRKLGFEEFMAILHAKWLRDRWYMLGIQQGQFQGKVPFVEWADSVCKANTALIKFPNLYILDNKLHFHLITRMNKHLTTAYHIANNTNDALAKLDNINNWIATVLSINNNLHAQQWQFEDMLKVTKTEAATTNAKKKSSFKVTTAINTSTPLMSELTMNASTSIDANQTCMCKYVYLLTEITRDAQSVDKPPLLATYILLTKHLAKTSRKHYIATDLLLSLDFQAHNNITINAALQTAIDTKTGTNILDPPTPPLPPEPHKHYKAVIAMLPHKCCQVEAKWIKDSQSAIYEIHKDVYFELLAKFECNKKCFNMEPHSMFMPMTTIFALIQKHIGSLAEAKCLACLDKKLKSEFTDCFLFNIPHVKDLPTDVYYSIDIASGAKISISQAYNCPCKFHNG